MAKHQRKQKGDEQHLRYWAARVAITARAARTIFDAAKAEEIEHWRITLHDVMLDNLLREAEGLENAIRNLERVEVR